METPIKLTVTPKESFTYKQAQYFDNGLVTSVFIALLHKDIVGVDFGKVCEACDPNYLRGIITKPNSSLLALSHIAKKLDIIVDVVDDKYVVQSTINCDHSFELNKTDIKLVKNGSNFSALIDADNRTSIDLFKCVLQHRLLQFKHTVMKFNGVEISIQDHGSHERNIYSHYYESTNAKRDMYNEKLKKLNDDFISAQQRDRDQFHADINKVIQQRVTVWDINHNISLAIDNGHKSAIDYLIENNVKLSVEEVQKIIGVLNTRGDHEIISKVANSLNALTKLT